MITQCSRAAPWLPLPYFGIDSRAAPWLPSPCLGIYLRAAPWLPSPCFGIYLRAAPWLPPQCFGICLRAAPWLPSPCFGICLRAVPWLPPPCFKIYIAVLRLMLACMGDIPWEDLQKFTHGGTFSRQFGWSACDWSLRSVIGPWRSTLGRFEKHTPV